MVGDLPDIEQTRDVADQMHREGAMGAVVHNACSTTYISLSTASPLLTALIRRPPRLIYLSSSMHRRGRTAPASIHWRGPTHRVSYADSTLYVTALVAAVARLWPDVLGNAVDPGWVPSKMGASGGPDDLRLGHLTQEWLATSYDPEARTSGGYWHHQHRGEARPAAYNHGLQSGLVNHPVRVTSGRPTSTYFRAELAHEGLWSGRCPHALSR